MNCGVQIMIKIVNGKAVKMTDEEIAEHDAAAKVEAVKAQMAERKRPLTAQEVYNMIVKQAVNTLEVDDNTALRMMSFYPAWTENTAYSVGYKVQRNGKLWRALQTHTAQTGWEPENAASLWEQINETHSGTADDPIPYEGNMALTNGLYYVQDYVVYLCNRDTGAPIYHALADLVGVYVEAT